MVWCIAAADGCGGGSVTGTLLLLLLLLVMMVTHPATTSPMYKIYKKKLEEQNLEFFSGKRLNFSFRTGLLLLVSLFNLL
jgi:hypothetical protein